MKKITLLSIMFLASCIGVKHTEVTKVGKVIIPFVAHKSDLTVINGVIGTVYNLEASQCDANPFETADGSIIKKNANVNKLRWVALSRDLINDTLRCGLHKVKGQWNGKIHFGDTIKVVSDNKLLCGLWVVKDCMNKRFSKRIDFMQDKHTGFYGKFENLKIFVTKI